MKTLAHGSLVVFAASLGLTGLASAPSPPPSGPDVDVRQIIDRALERSTWAREQNFGARYRYQMRQRNREFDGDGAVILDEFFHYAVAPYKGVPFASLLSKNGEPLTEKDQEEEAKRWEKFLGSLEKPEEEDDDEIAMVFDDELIERYTATYDGIQELHGRPTFVLSFEPRPGKLPVRRRTDHALNNSRGLIWIDQSTYEVARVSFKLTERVRLWWGILGSISDATGYLERRPAEPGGPWLLSELDLYYHVRVLLSTTRKGEPTTWNDFEPVG